MVRPGERDAGVVPVGMDVQVVRVWRPGVEVVGGLEGSKIPGQFVDVSSVGGTAGAVRTLWSPDD